MTEVPFESDFIRNEMRRLTKAILPVEEQMMRNDPVVRDIIVQNRRRKRAMANVTRAQLERMMGGDILYTYEEATGKPLASSRWERLTLKDPSIIRKTLAQEAKDLTNRIKDLKANPGQIQGIAGMELSDENAKEIYDKTVKELEDKLATNKALQQKYRTDVKRTRPKGRYKDVERLIDVKKTGKPLAMQKAQVVEEFSSIEIGTKPRSMPVWDEKRKKWVRPRKTVAPLRTIDESGAAIRELTSKEIQEQVVGRQAKAPRGFPRIEGSIVRQAGRKEFRVMVDDVWDEKLSNTVKDIVEKKPQTLVNIDKQTGKVVTKSVIRVGNKQIPIEVFRQAYRSLPKERAVAAAKILARVGTKFLGPLGVALTIADVIGLLAKAQAKES